MDKSRLVYSTDSGRICSSCSRPVAACTCKQKQVAPVPSDGVIRIRRVVKVPGAGKR